MKQFNKQIIMFAVTLMTIAVAKSWPFNLPVMYINTDNSAEIQKNTYATASCWIDPANSSYSALGSSSAPLALQIKGRGNKKWTNYDKKPYRLKFTAKQKPLGMGDSNKHFVLIPAADDDLCFLRFPVGMRLSMLLELKYTPEYRPIELVINSDYKGIYMLAEKVRVGKKRVNITEQLDNETDPEKITGGWLVEMDDNEETNQIVTTDNNGRTLRITYDSPEVLSSAQSEYLTSQINAITAAVSTTDKTSEEWQSLIDIDQLARYYIVQEVMDNIEAFHGSTFMYKDLGATTLWIFGPAWNFSDGLERDGNNFIYDGTTKKHSWIDEIAKFPAFQEKVKTIWADFYKNDYPTLSAFIDSFINQISASVSTDYERWNQYGCSDYTSAKNEFKARLNTKVEYLQSQWGENSVDFVNADYKQDNIIYDIVGRKISDAKGVNEVNLNKGIYIRNGKKILIK